MTISILRCWSGRIKIEAGRTGAYSLDILLNLIWVSAAIDEDVLDTAIC